MIVGAGTVGRVSCCTGSGWGWPAGWTADCCVGCDGG